MVLRKAPDLNTVRKWGSLLEPVRKVTTTMLELLAPEIIRVSYANRNDVLLPYHMRRSSIWFAVWRGLIGSIHLAHPSLQITYANIFSIDSVTILGSTYIIAHSSIDYLSMEHLAEAVSTRRLRILGRNRNRLASVPFRLKPHEQLSQMQSPEFCQAFDTLWFRFICSSTEDHRYYSK